MKRISADKFFGVYAKVVHCESLRGVDVICSYLDVLNRHAVVEFKFKNEDSPVLSVKVFPIQMRLLAENPNLAECVMIEINDRHLTVNPNTDDVADAVYRLMEFQRGKLSDEATL